MSRVFIEHLQSLDASSLSDWYYDFAIERLLFDGIELIRINRFMKQSIKWISIDLHKNMVRMIYIQNYKKNL